MSAVPSSGMLSITVPSYSNPSGYQITQCPKPVINAESDVVIKVHAASINPIDVKKADGAMKMIMKENFPYKIGYDCAGVVTEVGTGVTRVKVGDEVYTRLPERDRGAWSEFAKCHQDYVALKPEKSSFEEAAAVPLAAMTALQALRKYEGDLSGKTVFVPAGLSGTGSFACQLAKNLFGAKVITTVSTSKIPLVNELLGEGVVDEIIDYTKSDPRTVLPRGSVDFMFDTVGLAMDYLSLIRPKTGMIISIATTPSGEQVQTSGMMRIPSKPVVPSYIRILLNMVDKMRKYRASRWNVTYSYLFLDANGKDLDTLRELIEKGSVKPIVGTTANFKDMDEVRKACELVYNGKGGVGKAVITFPEN